MHLKTAIALAIYLSGSLVMGGCVSAPLLDEEQTANQFRAAKDEYGNPDLNGIWQALGTAHYDVEPHAARMGAVVAMGATGAIPAGLGVVVGGTIPYQDWALSQRDENRANWLARDPAVKCFMPGIPRATYMPLPFQIIQGDQTQIFAYE